MTVDRYQALLRSNNCYTLESNAQLLLLSPRCKFLIAINYFANNDANDSVNDDATNKILIFVYPAVNLPSQVEIFQVLSDNTMILTNSHDCEKAIGYSLRIDEEKDEVILKVHDFPNVGRNLISEKEVIGIHKKLWRPSVANT